jgi:SHAQKYF class myb-like DNA-binding protein
MAITVDNGCHCSMTERIDNSMQEASANASQSSGNSTMTDPTSNVMREDEMAAAAAARDDGGSETCSVGSSGNRVADGRVVPSPYQQLSAGSGTTSELPPQAESGTSHMMDNNEALTSMVDSVLAGLPSNYAEGLTKKPAAVQQQRQPTGGGSNNDNKRASSSPSDELQQRIGESMSISSNNDNGTNVGGGGNGGASHSKSVNAGGSVGDSNNNAEGGASDYARAHAHAHNYNNGVSINNGGGNKQKKKRRASMQEGQSAGRWTDAEHQAFLVGLQAYGREWKKVASHIPTRTSAQVRSHAQKYFAKIQKEEETWASQNSTTLEQEHAAAAASAGVASTLSPSVQSSVARIVAQPETVEAEVEETLQRLRERYRQLQRRLQVIEGREAPLKRLRDDMSSSTSLSSLQNEELIALSVLHDALPRGDGSLASTGSQGGTSDEDEEMEQEHE